MHDVDNCIRGNKTMVKNNVQELWIVLSILFVFLLLNICTATAYPFPDGDECMIAEPAINFIHGNGFQVRFSEILALYSFILVPWIKLFGASLLSIRSANMLCSTTALFTLWLAVKRLGVITSAQWRLFLMFLLFTEFGFIFTYRFGRYDGFGCLLMAMAVLLMSIGEKKTRLLALSILCLLVPWAGPQYMVALFAAGIVLFLLFRVRYWVEVAVSFISSAFGEAAFLLIVYISGRMKSYQAFLAIQQRSTGFLIELFKNGKLVHHNYLPKDFSLPALIAASLISILVFRRRQSAPQYRSVLFGPIFAAITSVLLLGVAKFPTYYSYLIAIPLGVSICSGLDACKSRGYQMTLLLACIMSALAGAGLNAVSYISDAHDHDYSLIERFVGGTLRKGDVAYVDPKVYLAARQRAADAYFPNPDFDIISKMSEEEKESITVVLIPPDWIEDTTRELGGQWADTGEELRPSGQGLFGNKNLGFLSGTLKDIRVLRRVADDSKRNSVPLLLRDRKVRSSWIVHGVAISRFTSDWLLID